MSDPTTPAEAVKAAASSVESAVVAEATTLWAKVKDVAAKYWPIAAGAAIAATRFI